MRLLYTLIIGLCAAAAVASAGTSFGNDHDDILNELRNLDKLKQAKPSEPVASVTPGDADILPADTGTEKPHQGNTVDHLADLLNGAAVEITLANKRHSNMKYTMFGQSKAIQLFTNQSEIIPTVDKYCHLFASLHIQLDHDDGSGPKLAHSVNTHCPANVRLKFASDTRCLRTVYTYDHVTDVLIRSPVYSPNFQLHRMFPSVEKLSLFLSAEFRVTGNLPNLTDVEINELYAKLVDLRPLAVHAPRIRNLKIDLWWEPEHLQQIDRLFTQLESLHISFKSETAQESSVISLLPFGLWGRQKQKAENKAIHFRNVQHFTVEFFFFEGKPIAGCVEKLATITFDQLKSMQYISMDVVDPDKQLELVTRHKGLTSVAFGAFTLPYSMLERLVEELPNLKHLTLFAYKSINNVLLVMEEMKTNLKTVTAVGDDAIRNAFLKETATLRGRWTLENDGFFTLPNIKRQMRSLTYKRSGKH